MIIDTGGMDSDYFIKNPDTDNLLAVIEDCTLEELDIYSIRDSDWFIPLSDDLSDVSSMQWTACSLGSINLLTKLVEDSIINHKDRTNFSNIEIPCFDKNFGSTVIFSPVYILYKDRDFKNKYIPTRKEILQNHKIADEKEFNSFAEKVKSNKEFNHQFKNTIRNTISNYFFGTVCPCDIDPIDIIEYNSLINKNIVNSDVIFEKYLNTINALHSKNYKKSGKDKVIDSIQPDKSKNVSNQVKGER